MPNLEQQLKRESVLRTVVETRRARALGFAERAAQHIHADVNKTNNGPTIRRSLAYMKSVSETKDGNEILSLTDQYASDLRKEGIHLAWN
jgi:hypothetical protein